MERKKENYNGNERERRVKGIKRTSKKDERDNKCKDKKERNLIDMEEKENNYGCKMMKKKK